MSTDENKAVLRRFFNVWESGAVSELPRLVADDYVGHVAAGDRDRDGLRDRILAFRSVMPDVVFTVDAQIAEGDTVASRLTASAIHVETGLPTRLMGLNLSRVRAGLIVEEWNAWETLDAGELDLLDDLDELDEVDNLADSDDLDAQDELDGA